MEKTAENFTVLEVPADKAYLSQENLEVVQALSGAAFVPFKSNSGSGEEGSLWEKMFHYYSYRREEFLRHYLPSAVERRKYLLDGQGEVPRPRSQQGHRGHEERGSVQVPLPQHLRRPSVAD